MARMAAEGGGALRRTLLLPLFVFFGLFFFNTLQHQMIQICKNLKIAHARAHGVYVRQWEPRVNKFIHRAQLRLQRSAWRVALVDFLCGFTCAVPAVSRGLARHG